MKSNTTTWGALLLLTGLGFLARSTLHGAGAAPFILTVAGVKCTALGWRFMELRRAHWFWRAALLGLLTVFLGGVVGLLARGSG